MFFYVGAFKIECVYEYMCWIINVIEILKEVVNL